MRRGYKKVSCNEGLTCGGERRRKPGRDPGFNTVSLTLMERF